MGLVEKRRAARLLMLNYIRRGDYKQSKEAYYFLLGMVYIFNAFASGAEKFTNLPPNPFLENND